MVLVAVPVTTCDWLLYHVSYGFKHIHFHPVYAFEMIKTIYNCMRCDGKFAGS